MSKNVIKFRRGSSFPAVVECGKRDSDGEPLVDVTSGEFNLNDMPVLRQYMDENEEVIGFYEVPVSVLNKLGFFPASEG